MNQTHVGKCFCGAVEIKVTGEPVAAGFCHCESCRSWSAAPVNAFSLWKPEAVTVTRGAENVGTYHPRAKPAQVNLNKARIEYWLTKGAKPSDSVRTLLGKHLTRDLSAAPVVEAPAAS